jgi:soluble lytic murein transglycosylase
MAYARLAARGKDDAAAAKKALDDGLAFEPQGDLFDKARKELATPGFARAVELARVGDTDTAKKELSALGLLKESDPGALWITATLLHKAGDARAAHNVARSRLTDWVRHFPSGKWKAAWEIAFPRPYEPEVLSASAREGVPTALIWAIMREESAFDPEVVSPSAAYGLMQLILPTAARYAKPLKLAHDAKALTQPEVNVPIGTAFLRKLRAEFPEHPNGYTVPSYNAGEGATHKWLSPPLAASFDLWVESIPYDETRKYTKRVLASYYAYVALYDGTHLDAELRVAAGK